jgi:uncharacterized Fe-S cluster-containing radical SAM superfamily protein
MAQRFINTDKFSEQMRERCIDTAQRRLLVTRFHGSEQELDFTEPTNCNGFGRVRHFHLDSGQGWPKNPLPIEPARIALGLLQKDLLRAQVFQLAACNWRCWYCFVDYSLLSANRQHAAFLSPAELIDLYLKEPDRAHVIDLTGGQPDLIPEWVPWIMKELTSRGLSETTYLWSDDNLSTDYFWQFLTKSDLDVICGYRNYGKVCCFKGFNADSFAFNTGASPDLFSRQFSLTKRLLGLGLDLYCYMTFTTPNPDGIADDMAKFVDSLQRLDPNLPLRTVPLRIRVFTPTKERLGNIPPQAFLNQNVAAEAWQRELSQRYTSQDLAKSITEVHLNSRE